MRLARHAFKAPSAHLPIESLQPRIPLPDPNKLENPRRTKEVQARVLHSILNQQKGTDEAPPLGSSALMQLLSNTRGMMIHTWTIAFDSTFASMYAMPAWS